MAIETYIQLDQFLNEIAELERQIADQVAMRDHVEASGKLSPGMMSLFVSIIDPLSERLAARKEAVDALTWEKRLHITEQALEALAFKERSDEEEDGLKREIAILREIRRCEDEICAAWWERHDGRLTPQIERWEREAEARMESLQKQL